MRIDDILNDAELFLENPEYTKVETILKNKEKNYKEDNKAESEIDTPEIVSSEEQTKCKKLKQEIIHFIRGKGFRKHNKELAQRSRNAPARNNKKYEGMTEEEIAAFKKKEYERWKARGYAWRKRSVRYTEYNRLWQQQKKLKEQNPTLTFEKINVTDEFVEKNSAEYAKERRKRAYKRKKRQAEKLASQNQNKE